jgi:hypothetical protein
MRVALVVAVVATLIVLSNLGRAMLNWMGV